MRMCNTSSAACSIFFSIIAALQVWLGAALVVTRCPLLPHRRGLRQRHLVRTAQLFTDLRCTGRVQKCCPLALMGVSVVRELLEDWGRSRPTASLRPSSARASR